MIKVIIVDDEPKAQDSLESLLQLKFKDKYKIISKCSSVDEAIVAINHQVPDLLFLDIQMPGKNGFSLMDHFPILPFEVIFVTAFKDYSYEAIKAHAFDYLLKPIDLGELEEAMLRFERNKEERNLNHKLDTIQANMEQLDIITFNSERGLDFVKINDIIYCESDNNYCTIFQENGKTIKVSKTLKNIHEKLPQHIFHRVHDKYVVNIKKIDSYDRRDNYLFLKNGEKISISIRKKSKFLDAING
ncbi:DNA-binding response regulator [Echinicola pacifica]|uniref:DNA-binding response regulator n=1 Tax=Echinicola pacifica TaxID=346377 RepID=A0A918UTC4_9BACT|nr:LytTR family DNA-binding domain-containing protein [Echinicola pacifica]GGZ31710.1 DNA-binding response regulator [Echinicola pacifica]